MARKLKIFGTILCTVGNEGALLGQPRHVRQLRAFVAVTTKKEAAEKFGISMHEANGYMGESGNTRETEIALTKPGQVFGTSLNTYDGTAVIEITRTPHVARKRIKKLSYAEQRAVRQAADEEKATREFTSEELQYLVDMFSSANAELAVSIANKASKQLTKTVP